MVKCGCDRGRHRDGGQLQGWLDMTEVSGWILRVINFSGEVLDSLNACNHFDTSQILTTAKILRYLQVVEGLKPSTCNICNLAPSPFCN